MINVHKSLRCIAKCVTVESRLSNSLKITVHHFVQIHYYTPRFNEVERGVYWYHLFRLSVCGQNRVRSVSSTMKFWRIFKICNFDFVFCWLGTQYDSMVLVIMRQWGYPQNAGVLVVLVELQELKSTSVEWYDTFAEPRFGVFLLTCQWPICPWNIHSLFPFLK